MRVDEHAVPWRSLARSCVAVAAVAMVVKANARVVRRQARSWLRHSFTVAHGKGEIPVFRTPGQREEQVFEACVTRAGMGT